MAHRIICSVSCCNILLKKGIGCAVIRQVFKEKCQNVCVIYLCEFMVLEGKVGPVILVAFISYHTTTLTSCNHTLGLILETCNSEISYIHWNTIKFHQWTEWMCCIFPQCALHEDNQFIIFSIAPWSVLMGLWTIAVVYGCKWSSFVAFHDDFSCASQTSGFYGDCYNLAPISSSSS
jgi:hypothetical protein